MRNKIRTQQVEIGIEQGTLSRSAVVRFVMLQSMPADLIAERVEKVILPVVARSEQRSGFSNQLLIGCQVLWLHLQIGFAVGDQIHFVCGRTGSSGQIDSPVMQPSDQG